MDKKHVNAIRASIELADKARYRLWSIPPWGQWLCLRLFGVDIRETRCDCSYAAHHLRKLLESEGETA